MGIPEMIAHFIDGIPDAEHGFNLLFSTEPFSGFQAELQWCREDAGGNWYREVATDLEGWLCPALFGYFDQAPRRLYVAAQPRHAGLADTQAEPPVDPGTSNT